MLKKSMLCLALVILQFSFAQQSMPGVALPSFRSTKPPSPPSELLASSYEDGKIRLNWTLSTSQDVGAYNIYSDNGTGIIDYESPIATVDHTTVTFTTPPLKNGITYRFGLRAVSTNDIEEKNTSVNSSAIATDTISKVGNITGNLKKLKEVTGDSEVSIIADVRIGDLEERRVMKEKENIEDISLRLTNKKRKVEEINKEMKEINSKLLNDRKELDSLKDELTLDREMLMAPAENPADRKDKRKSARGLVEYTEKLADKEKEVSRMLSELLDLKSRTESEEIALDAKDIAKQAEERIAQVRAIGKEIAEEKNIINDFKSKAVKNNPELEEILFNDESVPAKKTVAPVKTAEETGEALDVLLEKVEEVRKKITETGTAALQLLKERDVTLPEYKDVKEKIIDPSFEGLDKLEEVRKHIVEEKKVTSRKTSEPVVPVKSVAELTKAVKEAEKNAAVKSRELEAKKPGIEERPLAEKESPVYKKLDELESDLKVLDAERVKVVKKRNMLMTLEENIKSAKEKALQEESVTTTGKVSSNELPTAKVGTVSGAKDVKEEKKLSNKELALSPENSESENRKEGPAGEKNTELQTLKKTEPGKEKSGRSQTDVSSNIAPGKNETRKSEQIGENHADIKAAVENIDELLSSIDSLRKETLAKLPEAAKAKEEESIVASMKAGLEEPMSSEKAITPPQGPQEKTAELKPENVERLKNIGLKLDKILKENKAAIDTASRMAKDMTIADIRKEKNVGVDEKTAQVSIRLSEGAINFDYNKADIKPVYFKLLSKIVKYLALNPDSKIRVEGHTCYIGSDEYNKVLSKKRAAAVVDYFVRRGRLPAANFSSAGMGKANPIAPNETEEGRQKNRRVEIIIEK